MTTGRINQNATCFCLLSQEHQRRGGGGGRSWAEKPHARTPPPPPRPRSHKRTDSGLFTAPNESTTPAHSRKERATGPGPHSRGEERKTERRNLSHSLSTPARIPRAERHSIDTSASISRPVKPYTMGRQRAEYADPATR